MDRHPFHLHLCCCVLDELVFSKPLPTIVNILLSFEMGIRTLTITLLAWAIGLKLYASEIQPIATRGTATGLAQAANCITNFFGQFALPSL